LSTSVVISFSCPAKYVFVVDNDARMSVIFRAAWSKGR